MLGTLISAGSTLLGGLLGKSSADDARAATQRMADQNIALQREFAQNGIQWRVEDAKKAGIHPIYALGGGGASFSPVSAAFSADTSLPNALASAGQDVGRAIHATRSASGRVDAMGKAAAALQLEGLHLANENARVELASKTARLRAGQIGPPLPSSGDAYLIPGQSQSPLIKQKPLELAPSPSNAPHAEGGSHGDVGYARTVTGGYAPVPSKDAKDRNEDMLIPEMLWSWRNNILPNFRESYRKPPPFDPGPGREWRWSTSGQEYRSVVTPRRNVPASYRGPQRSW